MSTANKLRAEGRIEGKADGRSEALVESQARLLRQLAARFGAIPADLEARVRTGSSAELDDWSIRLVRTASLHEVFAAG